MSEAPNIRLLIVEDDEEDFMLSRDLVREIPGRRFAIEWARTFEDGLKAMAANGQDIVLLDFRLGARNGVELLQAARAAGAEAPVIMLTGEGHEDADNAAMKAGAADYLVKGRVEPSCSSAPSVMPSSANAPPRSPPSSRRGWRRSAPRWV